MSWQPLTRDGGKCRRRCAEKWYQVQLAIARPRRGFALAAVKAALSSAVRPSAAARLHRQPVPGFAAVRRILSFLWFHPPIAYASLPSVGPTGKVGTPRLDRERVLIIDGPVLGRAEVIGAVYPNCPALKSLTPVAVLLGRIAQAAARYALVLPVLRPSG